MALPKSQREKLRERQKLRTYREYTKNMTSIDINTQMDAESDYLAKENQILYRRLTRNDSELLNITPDNFRILGELAKNLPEKFHKDVATMDIDDLIRGHEYYRENPPAPKSNQIPLQVEQQIVDIALENLTWGSPHIRHAMQNLGFLELKEHHVRTAMRRNHIPVSAKRIQKGLPWRDFIKAMKSTNGAGVIFK
jgi:hypothetical protein